MMHKRTLWLVYGLVLVGVLARLAPHPPNVTPLVAVALVSGACLPRRWALLVPLVIMMVSDWLIGYDPQVVFNWAGFVVAGCIGFLLREQRSLWRVGAATLSSSTAFFLISNFGVWSVGQLYPRTVAGLHACYVAGIPFYRQMLAGDLGYAVLLFGAIALVTRWQRPPAPAYSH